MKSGCTEIIVILDKSGSMSIIKNDAIGGFNEFVESQKKEPGTANVTLVLFNHEYQLVYEGVDIQKVEILSEATYVPSGNTAMNDAIGKTINQVGTRLSNTPEDQKPEKVLICILTDGEENASREYTQSQIAELVKHQEEKYSWKFIFLAANQDAVLAGGKIGISKDSTLNFVANSEGTTKGYRSMSKMSSNYRNSK